MAERHIETFNFPRVDIGFFLQRLEEDMVSDMNYIKKQKQLYSEMDEVERNLRKEAGMQRGVPSGAKSLAALYNMLPREAPTTGKIKEDIAKAIAPLAAWSKKEAQDWAKGKAEYPDSISVPREVHSAVSTLVSNANITPAQTARLNTVLNLIAEVLLELQTKMAAADGVSTRGLMDKIAVHAQEYKTPSPMLAIGKAGIGKTEGIRGVAKKLGIGFLELRLCNYTETDLVGIPYLTDDKTTAHATNTLLPTVEQHGEYGILLVDEFTSTQASVQVPILQLTDSSRGVGNYKLPAGWKVVLAGNGPDDGGTFMFLPGTVISRAACYYVDPSTNAWLEKFAPMAKIHPTITAYIHQNPDSLHRYGNTSDGAFDRAFPCPRSWAALSNALYDVDLRASLGEAILNNNTKDIPDVDDIRLDPLKYSWAADEKRFNTWKQIVERIVGSRIGASEASQFVMYLQHQKDVVNPQDIMSGKKGIKALADMSPSAQYLTISALSAALSAYINKTFGGQNGIYVDTFSDFSSADAMLSMAASTDVTDSYNPEFLKTLENVLTWLLAAMDKNGRMDHLSYAIEEVSTAVGGTVLLNLSTPDCSFAKKLPKFGKLLKEHARIGAI